MVLGITLRRKRKEDTTDDSDSVVPSPTLPVLAPSDFQWPSDFIADGVDQPPQAGPGGSPNRAPVRQPSASNIPYHRPFRKDSINSNGHGDAAKGGEKQPRQSIASMYASPVAAFNRVRKASTAGSVGVKPSRNKRRVPRVIPTFNIMVVGGANTGKTSISRLLLQTCQLSPLAAPAHRDSLEKFMKGSVRSTGSVETVTVEIDEGPDRIALTLMDTPGLLLGNELDLERSVTSILRHFDTRFAETLDEENKVDRRNKGDQHVHLCIYLIAPEAIKLRSVAERPAAPPPAPAAVQHSQKEVLSRPQSPEVEHSTEKPDADGDEPAPDTLSGSEPATPPLTNGPSPVSFASAIPDVATIISPPSEPQMCLDEANIYVIKRLSSRVNVLPVVSRSDTMTNERLEEIKSIVRRDLKRGGVQISSILGQLEDSDSEEDEDGDDEEDHDEEEPEDEEPRTPRTVVRIRPTTPGATQGPKRRTSFSQRSRSRTRAALTDEDVDFELADVIFPKGVRTMRGLFPFAVMSPDPVPTNSSASTNGKANPAGIPIPATPPPSSFRRRSVTLDAGDHLKELRGKYTRNYRWGSVDVLNPEHCDFLALRHAILGPRMRVLKQTTNEVLYEKFRTQKLLELKSLNRRPADSKVPNK